jgi:hypothetical protein
MRISPLNKFVCFMEPKRFRKYRAISENGALLVEVLISATLLVLVGAAVALMTSTGLRLSIRNFATNFSHQSARNSFQTLQQSLESSMSNYRLFNFPPAPSTATTFTFPAATATTDTAPGTNYFVSAPRHGVEFWALSGGPYLVTNIDNDTSAVTISTVNPRAFPNQPPRVGNQVHFPTLGNRTFFVTGIVGANTPAPVLTLAGFNGKRDPEKPLTASLSVYQRVIFYVRNGRLLKSQMPREVDDVAAAITTDIVATGITVEQPFSFVFDSLAGTTDRDKVQISFEAHDPGYTARRIRTGTCSMNSLVSLRRRPALFLNP